MKYTVRIDEEGTFWYKEGTKILHREDGPAIEYADGRKYWWLNGKRHREDGPAIEWADGGKFWYFHGKVHREDGPACEWADGTKSWYLNGKLHREDGPAIEFPNGTKLWYLNGKGLSEEEFNARKVNMLTIDGKTIELSKETVDNIKSLLRD